MPRTKRLFLPRAGFHITARTQGGAKWFTEEIRAAIANDIDEAVPAFGHELLAYVVMPNHFHIVLKQGTTPLAWVMQRIMQRAVNHVRRRFEGEGHVFGRPYWSSVCSSPGYLRRAIVYAHLNPCAANICCEPEEYSCSTHSRYLSPQGEAHLAGLMLFAHNSTKVEDVIRSYREFVEFTVQRRKTGTLGDWLLPTGPDSHLLPYAAHGDSHWASTYSTFSEPTSFTCTNVDVAHHAVQLLRRIDAQLSIDIVRHGGNSRPLMNVKYQLIAGLLSAGCRTTAIARCLQVSPSLVSQIRTRMRLSASHTT